MDVRRGMAAIVAAAALAAAAAAAGGAAYAASDGDGPIPAWVKTVFGYYAAGEITDDEIIAALEYLIAHGIIQVGAAPAAAPDGAEPEHAGADLAERVADEAEFNEALAERLRDDMQAFRIELRAGGYIPGHPDDYADVIETGRAEIRAVEAYAAALRAAAADGEITAAERAPIEAAGRAADDAAQAAADAVAASPMGQYLAFAEGLAGAFVGSLGEPSGDGGGGGGGGGGAAAGPAACPTPAELVAQAAPVVREAGATADDAGYRADLEEQRRQHLRNFEAGLSGAYTFRANGDFGSAGAGAASDAGGNVAAYDDMLAAIKSAIRAGERLAATMERAAEDGEISASEAGEITEAEALAEAAGCVAAAEYDATPSGRTKYGGMFRAYMDGFR